MPEAAASQLVIPDELKRALEEDRVVFFCGAGVSMGAGLPDFRGLVERCFDALGADKPGEHDPQWDWPDRMLDQLERTYGAAPVRAQVDAALAPEPTSLELHTAILELARVRRHPFPIRLVTTYFDTYFEKTAAAAGMPLTVDAAPKLPIPRDDQAVSWGSLVHLHGVRETEKGGRDLVLTSTDFDRAYLVDGWAARFATKLFDEFTVVFIGYSLNDPVLRYLTAARAAERSQSRALNEPHQPYIFVGAETSELAPEAWSVWRERGIEPIPYSSDQDHRALKTGLAAWATQCPS